MMQDSQTRRGAPAALAAALIALLLVGGCGRSERSREPRRSETANASEKADKPQPANAAEDRSSQGEEDESASSEEQTASGSGESRSRGRQARCEFNDEPAQACTFTQVLGDGSFDVETSDRTVRVLVDGQEAAAFEVFGPERRVPLPGNFRRDRSDPACWVADDTELPLYRVCAR